MNERILGIAGLTAVYAVAAMIIFLQLRSLIS